MSYSVSLSELDADSFSTPGRELYTLLTPCQYLFDTFVNEQNSYLKVLLINPSRTLFERRLKRLSLTTEPCNKSLAMTYSHMGKPHTTIGAERFHF